MVEIVQYFNGERKRTVGRAKSHAGVIRLLKSVRGASEGWGCKIHGTSKALQEVGAHREAGGFAFSYSTKRGSVVRCHSFFCVEEK